MTRLISSATSASQATMDKVLYGSGYANEVVALLAYRITYNGATWTVAGSTGSDQSRADVTATWDGVNYKLDIDLSGLSNQFTNSPVPVVSPWGAAVYTGDARYQPEARSTSVSDIEVRFWDPGQSQVGGGTTVDYATTESTKMDFCILIVGTID